MADDAFALSPISARAAQPSDEDYGAIHEAFMETSRGRWFLTEYAKRNRNADTRAVLDAVARIEDTLAQQKPDAEAAEPSSPASDPRLHELEQRHASIIAAIGAAFDAARNALPASEPAINAAAGFEEALAPIRHAGQMVQGVAWTLRESGADGRICTLLDQQAKAIAQAVLHPVFDRMKSASAQQASAADVFAAFDVRLHALFEQDSLAFAPDLAARAEPSQPRIIVPSNDFEIVEHVAEHVVEHADRAEQTRPAPGMSDAAISDLDIDLFDDPPEPAAPGLAATGPATNPAPANLAAKNPVTNPADMTADQIPDTSLGLATLGAAIIDTTLKTNAARAHADPLAPFARMTKAERIAFFS